ncbi:hypothetical protein DDE82_009158 [Stemphylium lycopersici]|uniref:Uncharacterized protein n=1 Tax=Stemphylium lycopersici TaxID=183478 RepID=A0A364MR72_STELY|nr:hypothetical protein DDE82_009158 [Stemphylium lycopersici]RAQ99183.1 hypothetical protein DDE83_009203 [Stemphylium lycopersici]
MTPTKRASDDLTRPRKRVRSFTARGTVTTTRFAPNEGSERVTAASSAAALDNETLQEALDASLMDDFEGVDCRRLRKYTKPLSSQKSRKSWIYRYGYRVALLKDPNKLYFVLRHCYEHKCTETVTT